MEQVAAAWLDLLEPAQRRTAEGAAPGADATDADRRRWFYTPTDHGGLTLTSQRPVQQQAAMRLVASGLSEAGYVTVAAILGLENVLDRVEGFDSGHGRSRDPGRYYVRVFGRPGREGLWGWRFGGHHVSLNNLVVEGEVVATTPQFLGANPASAPLLGGVVHRPLSQVEDLARELVRSMPSGLAARAVLAPRAPDDVLTGNTPVLDVGDLPAAEGAAGSELDAAQRGMLLELLATYFDRVPPALSPLSTYDDAALAALRFGWAGPTEPGAPHYYRVQGPGLLVEWDNTQNGANHAHSVWRDPEGDFGLDVLARHRAEHHS
jgi:hypothetical protein